MKTIILKMSELRETIVYDEKYVQIDDEGEEVPPTLFDKLGGIEGMKSIINTLFENIMKDPSLSQFYKKSNLDVVKNKYTYFLAMQIGGPFDLMFGDLT